MEPHKNDPRRDSVSMVGPYARKRAILAVILILLGLVVLAVRTLGG